jgi:acetyltransferase-like isoleucine patch superfamily enzyme
MSSRFRSSRFCAIYIGAETYVTFKTLLTTYDASGGDDRPIYIGRRCFIGGGSFIGPGVTIGDECIVAAGAVVISDLPPRCIVAGNPAQIIRRGIAVGPYGRLTALTK